MAFKFAGGMLSSACVIGALAVSGCGNEVTDATEAVDGINKELETVGASIDCPGVKEIEGDTFECDLKGTESGKTEKVTLKLVGEEKDTVDIADQKAYDKALQEVVGGG